MKSRGMTVVELIVSIGLISLVMLFVFRILLDVRQEEINSGFKAQDTMNRSLIIKTIQSDFITKQLKKIEEITCSSSDDLICLKFSFEDGQPTNLYIRRNEIEYGEVGKTEKWALSTGNYDVELGDDLSSRKYCYKYKIVPETDPEYFYLTLIFYDNLKGHTLEDNVLLDIELFYTGKIEGTEFPTELTGATKICDYHKTS